MAVERLKFRCYQCNQLLASLPAKAGSIVSCPRCKADLVVPAPDSPAAVDQEASPVGKASGRAGSTLTPPKLAVPAGLDEAAAAMPADLIDLRPEDLRVEAEFFESLTRAPRRPRNSRPRPGADQNRRRLSQVPRRALPRHRFPPARRSRRRPLSSRPPLAARISRARSPRRH